MFKSYKNAPPWQPLSQSLSSQTSQWPTCGPVFTHPSHRQLPYKSFPLTFVDPRDDTFTVHIDIFQTLDPGYTVSGGHSARCSTTDCKTAQEHAFCNPLFLNCSENAICNSSQLTNKSLAASQWKTMKTLCQHTAQPVFHTTTPLQCWPICSVRTNSAISDNWVLPFNHNQWWH